MSTDHSDVDRSLANTWTIFKPIASNYESVKPHSGLHSKDSVYNLTKKFRFSTP